MMQTRVIGVVSKPPRDRKQTEIRVLLPWLRKKSDLLSKSNNEVLEDIIKNCDYRLAIKDDVIVTQGEKGDCFYIMLSGKTSVFIDTTKSDDDEAGPDQVIPTAEAADGDTAHHGWLTGRGSPEADDGTGDTTKKKPLDRSSYGKFIIHFDAGKSFGEIALISEDSVRNATVIADEDTDLLVIHRDLFNRSMKAQQEKEYAERKAFIAECRLFSDWSAKFKHLLEMSIRKEVLPYGAPLMKQGEPADGIMFIVSGQAKLTTDPGRHEQQYSQLMTQRSVIEQEFGRHNKENVYQKAPGGLTQQQIRVRRKEGYAAAERRFMNKTIDLCTIENNEVIGDLEVVMEMSTCSATVTCTATTTVFILDAKNYERLVLKKNTHTVTKLKHGVLKKLQSRISTTNGAQVPLFKIVHDKLEEERRPKFRDDNKRIKVDDERSMKLAQMVKLYLSDRGPLLDPLLPDSFHARLMSEKRNKLLQKRDNKKSEAAALLRQRRMRVPRSLKQLQTSAAESELLHPGGSWLAPSKPSKDAHVRPKTAIGIESRSDIERSGSPGSGGGGGSRQDGRGGVFHLTECEAGDVPGETVLKERAVLVTQTFDHMFQQIDNLQREKSEARLKMICSVAAKAELRDETERAHLGYTADDMYDLHADDYFDYETSAGKLKNLEQRVKLFCDEVRQKRYNDPLRVDEMRTFQVKDADSVPITGGTVYVSRRPCIYPKSARTKNDAHQHIRRFIITRDQNKYTSSSAVLRPKSAMPFTSKQRERPKTAW
ncbi:uncharacterized protein LOC127875051 isoform X2 [Dreissena polymorpha]|nr:uncharacterized protein LOC127875051 isoform X2 [Dreissena polymorpha]XP_052275824.1 uncharacterized protein LOC127875051 isoform X2 [Dreissena polymorpha]XP_052275825.1 uncharacterized protein LOC127875051 isoform X2 [Dreissena polymorpha]